VISHISGIAIEAMLLDKPVIVMKYEYAKDDISCYSDDDAVVSLYRPEDLQSVCEEILFGHNLRSELQAKRAASIFKYNYVNDGHAADRVLSLINEMADNEEKVLT
jgi:hypothetical protein